MDGPGDAPTSRDLADREGVDMPKATCSIEGCDVFGPTKRTWCGKHYARWRRTNTPDPGVLPRDRSAEDRLWGSVDKESSPHGCWLWTGVTSKGYGYFHLKLGNGLPSRHVLVHRFAYEAVIGPIPDGFTIDHLCRERLCVNPDHLEPVSGPENTRRAKFVRGFGDEMWRRIALPKLMDGDFSFIHDIDPETGRMASGVEFHESDDVA